MFRPIMGVNSGHGQAMAGGPFPSRDGTIRVGMGYVLSNSLRSIRPTRATETDDRAYRKVEKLRDTPIRDALTDQRRRSACGSTDTRPRSL